MYGSPDGDYMNQVYPIVRRELRAWRLRKWAARLYRVALFSALVLALGVVW
jgi:hypothetical protein